jgi:hypothetical protein
MDKQEEGGASTRLLQEVSGLLRWARASAKGGYLQVFTNRRWAYLCIIKRNKEAPWCFGEGCLRRAQTRGSDGAFGHK